MEFGGYVRLSYDEDKKDYASITAQKEIVKQYAEDHNIEVTHYYEDDDYSGYVFNGRPAFEQMLLDLESNVIDGVISKDLSRIGRHSAHTLLFIENLKSMNKSIIAIDDSYNSRTDQDDIIGIKTWYNERYVKDLSKKIRSNITSYMRNNTYLNSVPYGYLKNDETNSLIVDEEAKLIIREIFNMYLNGDGVLKIARYLNDKGEPSPAEHIKQVALHNGKIYKYITKNKWTDGTIINILKNDVYKGVRRQKKTKRDGIHGKITYTNEYEQYVFENCHEPIISENDFDLVQKLIEKRKVLNYRGQTKNYNPYSGFLFCSDCNSTMIAHNLTNRAKRYICSSYKRYGNKECSSHHIREDYITIHVKQKLEEIYESLSDKNIIKINQTIENKIETDKNFDNIINKTKKEIEQLQNKYQIIQNLKIDSIMKNPEQVDIVISQYDIIEKENLCKIEILKEQLGNFKESRDNSHKLKENIVNAKYLIETILNSDIIEKKYLEYIIDRIIVTKDGTPIIKVKDILNSCV